VTELADEIREVAAQYPESRSAILPALRLAQEHHDGWLPPEAFEEVGVALGLTPAYCESVASFYDMLHLRPGVRCGETTEDGEITLRAVECLGGCGWPTIVAVDDYHRRDVQAADVPAILEELRGG